MVGVSPEQDRVQLPLLHALPRAVWVTGASPCLCAQPEDGEYSTGGASWLLGVMLNIRELVLTGSLLYPLMQMARSFLKEQQKFALRYSRTWGFDRRRQKESEHR